MSELARITAHYLEAIVQRAGLRGFDEIRAELEAAASMDADAHARATGVAIANATGNADQRAAVAAFREDLRARL